MVVHTIEVIGGGGDFGIVREFFVGVPEDEFSGGRESFGIEANDSPRPPLRSDVEILSGGFKRGASRETKSGSGEIGKADICKNAIGDTQTVHSDGVAILENVHNLFGRVDGEIVKGTGGVSS